MKSQILVHYLVDIICNNDLNFMLNKIHISKSNQTLNEFEREDFFYKHL